VAKGTINKVIVLGRIGVNPEVRYMSSGMAVMSLSVATNDGYKNKDTGQFVESTEWHRVTVFGKQAETLGTYAKKGDLLYVEGRIKTTKYQDKNTGQDRYSTEIVAVQTQMIGGKSREQDSPLPDYIPSHVPMPSASENFPSAAANRQSSQPIKVNQTKPDINALNDVDLDVPPF